MNKNLLKPYLVFTYRSALNSGVKEFAKDFDDEDEAIKYAKELKEKNQCNYVDIMSLKTDEESFPKVRSF